MPYPYDIDIPELVGQAHHRATEIGFPLLPHGRPIGQPAPTTATTPADGLLLRALVAAHPEGLIGEIGTGPGVSTAWLISGMGSKARLISCDISQSLAEGAAAFFRAFPNVEIRWGDWEEVLTPDGPFDLLFFDANASSVLASRHNWDRVAHLVRVGGQIVMDDLAPIEMWPEAWKGMTDYKREFCLCNPRLAGVEVRTSATTVSVVGTRIR